MHNGDRASELGGAPLGDRATDLLSEGFLRLGSRKLPCNLASLSCTSARRVPGTRNSLIPSATNTFKQASPSHTSPNSLSVRCSELRAGPGGKGYAEGDGDRESKLKHRI